MNQFLKTSEGFLVALGGLAIMLFALYGISNVIIQYAPAPLGDAFSGFIRRTDMAGWSNT